ncbi:MAG: DUF5668 domain-containing protein [Bacteroidota bacterium]
MANLSLDKKSVLGIVLLIIGSLFVMKNLGFIPYHIKYYVFHWYNILLLFGTLLLFSRENRDTGIILAAIGGFFLFRDLGYLHFYHLIDFWPVALIVAGLMLLLKKKPVEQNGDDINNTLESRPNEEKES